ncbi:MAG: hypothetical protein LBQ54_14800 [Planctomycetaceae bacterium]|jgi:hypothetical protein|nr:hypothetical protein [Planctomycetaceae bacterium]
MRTSKVFAVISILFGGVLVLAACKGPELAKTQLLPGVLIVCTGLIVLVAAEAVEKFNPKDGKG